MPSAKYLYLKSWSICHPQNVTVQAFEWWPNEIDWFTYSELVVQSCWYVGFFPCLSSCLQPLMTCEMHCVGVGWWARSMNLTMLNPISKFRYGQWLYFSRSHKTNPILGEAKTPLTSPKYPSMLLWILGSRFKEAWASQWNLQWWKPRIYELLEVKLLSNYRLW